MPGFHHVELWVDDLAETRAPWEWLLDRLEFTRESVWPGGQSWSAGGAYLTLTTSPTMTAKGHDRRAPGVNHLAFAGGTPAAVDAIMAEAGAHGWRRLYDERYPHAGGVEHYAGWLEHPAGFKVEIVATDS